MVMNVGQRSSEESRPTHKVTGQLCVDVQVVTQCNTRVDNKASLPVPKSNLRAARPGERAVAQGAQGRCLSHSLGLWSLESESVGL